MPFKETSFVLQLVPGELAIEISKPHSKKKPTEISMIMLKDNIKISVPISSEIFIICTTNGISADDKLADTLPISKATSKNARKSY